MTVTRSSVNHAHASYSGKKTTNWSLMTSMMKPKNKPSPMVPSIELEPARCFAVHEHGIDWQERHAQRPQYFVDIAIQKINIFFPEVVSFKRSQLYYLCWINPNVSAECWHEYECSVIKFINDNSEVWTVELGEFFKVTSDTQIIPVNCMNIWTLTSLTTAFTWYGCYPENTKFVRCHCFVRSNIDDYVTIACYDEYRVFD